MNLDGIKYIFQIPLAWFRQVGAFVFNSYGGNLVQIRRNVDGSAEFFVDPNELKQKAQEGLAEKFVTLDTAQTITESKTFASAKGIILKDVNGNTLTMRGYGGSSGFFGYFGSNTRNALFNFTSTSATFGGGTVANIYIDADPVDSTSTTSKQIASRGWVNSKFFRPSTTSTGVVYNTNGTITYKAIGTTANDVAAGHHTHPASDITGLPASIQPYTSTPAALSGNGSAGSSALYARGDHSHPYPDITDLKCMISGHLNTCLLIVDANGDVTHSGNDMYDALSDFAGDYLDGAVTIKRHRTGGALDKTIVSASGIALYTATPSIGFHFGLVSSATSSIVETASGKIQINSPNHATLSVDPAFADASNPTPAELLQIATTGWVLDEVAASNPSSSVQTMPPTNTADADAANTDTWTAGGNNGVSKTVLYRTKYVTSGTTPILYGYFRTETYDRYGRLYHVSGETRATIDSTYLITLS